MKLLIDEFRTMLKAFKASKLAIDLKEAASCIPINESHRPVENRVMQVTE
jgi:hypothetical protein